MPTYATRWKESSKEDFLACNQRKLKPNKCVPCHSTIYSVTWQKANRDKFVDQVHECCKHLPDSKSSMAKATLCTGGKERILFLFSFFISLRKIHHWFLWLNWKVLKHNYAWVDKHLTTKQVNVVERLPSVPGHSKVCGSILAANKKIFSGILEFNANDAARLAWKNQENERQTAIV